MFTLHLNDHDIFIGDSIGALSVFLKNNHFSKIAVLVDEHTRLYCLPLILENEGIRAEVIEIPSGEMHKNIDTCQTIWREMMRSGLDRQSLLLLLGGGVLGDMGGFCAATFLRGIAFAQIPTTLLAQVDASIGGKTGIDFDFIKNSVGLFQNPRAVFVDPIFLKTLPEAEIRSGFAEIIKHALIADAGAWESLKKIETLSGTDWLPHLQHSLSIKKQIVETDPREKGIRKALNFGHTVGHALESYFLKITPPLLHGEAVAQGMLCESWLSWKVCGLPEAALSEITAFIRRFYPPLPLPPDAPSAIFEWMKKDKKNDRGRINFSLLSAIGEVRIDQFCEEEAIRQCLTDFGA